jgi:hypothetical protein
MCLKVKGDTVAWCMEQYHYQSIFYFVSFICFALCNGSLNVDFFVLQIHSTVHRPRSDTCRGGCVRTQVGVWACVCVCGGVCVGACTCTLCVCVCVRACVAQAGDCWL